jgi:hypothetical protein
LEENSFGCGASANVAHADKQDFVSVFGHVVRGEEVGVWGQKTCSKLMASRLFNGTGVGLSPQWVLGNRRVGAHSHLQARTRGLLRRH